MCALVLSRTCLCNSPAQRSWPVWVANPSRRRLSRCSRVTRRARRRPQKQRLPTLVACAKTVPCQESRPKWHFEQAFFNARKEAREVTTNAECTPSNSTPRCQLEDLAVWSTPLHSSTAGTPCKFHQGADCGHAHVSTAERGLRTFYSSYCKAPLYYN